ncbi:hypothetical protein OI25_8258 (plasmid) [Paraburkholderia fungorum]|jgi:hypothetical protein|uniref:Uncharacterized protein n=1 Tax=Paraburkholderia fungorum TaxID=134537 RepID=A0AAU8SSH5_9BURK|nr:hypothetical protein OI25_8258 [Paraburkholderia fungorum]
MHATESLVKHGSRISVPPLLQTCIVGADICARVEVAGATGRVLGGVIKPAAATAEPAG